MADEASMERWPATKHPALGGDVPQELIDAGEGGACAETSQTDAVGCAGLSRSLGSPELSQLASPEPVQRF